MTYADECIERAEKATEGPWLTAHDHVYQPLKENPKEGYVMADTKACEGERENAEFIAHARTDVPELARRLKRTCEILRDQASTYSNRGPNVQHHLLDELRQLADELEALPEEKKADVNEGT